MVRRTQVKPPSAAKEVSAGGIVLEEKGVLLIKVQDLAGQVVWTFPKGHLEKGETVEEAALREVREETGWTCRLLSPLGQVRYGFLRDLFPVAKVVHWFRMAPVKRTGLSDPEEVQDCRWVELKEAADLVVYPSDKKIMKRLLKGLNT
jgi:8-oxo-dGTP pyrophosphatase MutT (NUDIX family)